MADRIFNWGDVRVSRHLPAGYYDFKIESLEEAHSQEKGLLMYVVEATVQAPSSQAGKKHVEYMLFGKTPFETDSEDEEFQAYADLEDLEAEDPLTAKYSNGMRTFKKVFEAAGLELDSDDISMNEIIDKANSGGLTFGARLFVEEQDAGRTRNNFGQCYTAGTETPRIEEPKRRGQRGGGAAAARQRTPGRGEQLANRTREATEEDQD